jgi:high-affinity iron transporter
VLATFLIGLREGMEAALVVSILVAYLVRSGRRAHLPHVWAGIGAAVLLSAAVGALLAAAPEALGERAEETLAGVLSILTVALVTWMVFWMARTARHLKAGLEARMSEAVAAGGLAVAGVGFLAVAREGIETALFLWAGSTATAGTAPLVGVLLGLATAAALGWTVYAGAVRLNLRTFFAWTGFALVVVAAGVLAYGVHELQEVGVLPGEGAIAYDVSGIIAKESTLGTVLRGLVGFRPAPSWLEVVAWWAYVVPATVLYARALRPRRTPAAPAEVTAEAVVA